MSQVADTCACPKATCDLQCEVEESTDFYAEKCPGGKTRSCAKPTCVKLDPYPKHCEAKYAKRPSIGVVDGIEGKAWKVENDKKYPIDDGSLVSEKDVIEVGQASRVEITFDDGNQISLSQNSYVVLAEVLNPSEEDKRRTLLKLLRGKIRSKVKEDKNKLQNREPAQSNNYKFRIETPSAVAGVRGTDFVVHYDENETLDQASTHVSTLNGLVDLSGHDSEEKSQISKNQTGSFIEKEFSARRAGKPTQSKPTLTPVREMTAEEGAKLRQEMLFAASYAKNRSVASEDDYKCEAPKAKFNQCSWYCENNPKGERKCRTDLKGVECVRRICNAKGQWQKQSRLPASYGDYCHPTDAFVGPCNY